MTHKVASLHAGLIVRKGEAVPAPLAPSHPFFETYRPAPVAHTFKSSDAPRSITDRLNANREAAPASDAPPQAPMIVATEAFKSYHDHYRMTFRMTGSQRRRLRIAAAQSDRSLQQVLSQALDNYVDDLCACSLKNCTCMARAAEQSR